MSRRLPNGLNNKQERNKKRILIICEGQEEKIYIEKLIQLNVWNNDVYVFETKNAESAYKIPNVYDLFRRDEKYSVVLIFCDTDDPPYDAIMSIKKGLKRIFGGDSGFNRIVIFANPCTMRIFMAHFSEHNKVKSHKKSDNAPIIEKYTGVKNYSGKEDQTRGICDKLNAENYAVMKQRICNVSQKYTEPGSTNLHKFLELFEGSDTLWIKEIDNALFRK